MLELFAYINYFLYFFSRKGLITELFTMTYEIEYNYETGWPDNIVSRLNISMGLYRRRYRYVKVGITADPQRRFNEHKNSHKYNLDRMIVVYETTSVKNANQVED